MWFFKKRSHNSGWQPERHTGEVVAVRNTDTAPAVHYPLHQSDVRMFDPSPLLNHPAWLQWLSEQSVLQPRYADEKTGPKTRQQLDGHLQQVRPQYAPYQPPQGTPRDGMQRLTPRTPIPETPQADTLAPLPGLPRWLVGATPAGDLPVERQSAANPAPAQMQHTANDGQLDATLATLPYSNHPQEARPLTVLELPPWIGAARSNSRPLPPLMGFSDPDLTPDLPTEKQTQEQADAWLNDVPAPTVEIWEEFAPPVLAPLPEQSLSVSDRVAISNAFGVTEEDCEPDFTDEDDTDATRASALLKLRFCEHKKESE